MEKCVMFLATLFATISIGLSNGDNNMEYSSAYIEIDKNVNLPAADKVIASIYDWSPSSCGLKCIRKSLCRSFNVATKKNDNGMVLCEMLSTKPRSCVEILKEGHKTSGVYTINPDGQGAFSVYCDMETDGGGWTVLQRRQDGSVNFVRPWNDYKNGFGSLEGEFWLGNDKIHRLTSSQEVEVRFDLEDFEGNKRYAVYENFTVLDEKSNYKVFFGAYRGTAGDSFKKHRGMEFSTFDRDNDSSGARHCAVVFKGAWWFEDCHNVNINGIYWGGKTWSYATGVTWYTFKGDFYSLKKTEMKIRP